MLAETDEAACSQAALRPGQGCLLAVEEAAGLPGAGDAGGGRARRVAGGLARAARALRLSAPALAGHAVRARRARRARRLLRAARPRAGPACAGARNCVAPLERECFNVLCDSRNMWRGLSARGQAVDNRHSHLLQLRASIVRTACLAAGERASMCVLKQNEETACLSLSSQREGPRVVRGDRSWCEAAARLWRGRRRRCLQTSAPRRCWRGCRRACARPCAPPSQP